MKIKRNIIRIDQGKCNGCGLCVTACAEGAIKLIGGKAQLVSDVYCDGLGACLGRCPQDAITIEVREAEPFDEAAARQHLASDSPSPAQRVDSRPATNANHHCACPGMQTLSFDKKNDEKNSGPPVQAGTVQSELSQWPVQLQLVSPEAPYWNGADLLVAADCVPFAFAGFHETLLRGRKLVIACPKLDDTDGYVEKLAAIIANNDIKSITVARMLVPCCGGIVRITEMALDAAGKNIPLNVLTIGLDGEIVEKRIF